MSSNIAQEIEQLTQELKRLEQAKNTKAACADLLSYVRLNEPQDPLITKSPENPFLQGNKGMPTGCCG